jgi:hypothetical protein
MNRAHLFLSVSIATLAAGCEPTPDTPSDVRSGPRIIGHAPPPLPVPPDATLMVNPNRRVVSGAGEGRVGADTIKDSSGMLETKVWQCDSGASMAHQVVQCQVDPDFVLVGGGAWAIYGGAGALLTASYPVDLSILRTWEARSKDHIQSDPHFLRVYAFGLRVDGLSRDTLLGYISITQNTSDVTAHPVAAPDNLNDALPLGGGARVNYTGAGNLLTTLLAGSAASKDHVWSDPASITAYSLYIDTQVGSHPLTAFISNGGTSSDGGVQRAKVFKNPAYVATGIGALTSHNETAGGRLLTRIAPQSPGEFWVESKDHMVPDGGSTIALLYQIQARR